MCEMDEWTKTWYKCIFLIMDYHQNSLKAIVLDPKTDTNKYTNKYKPGIIPAIQNPTV